MMISKVLDLSEQKHEKNKTINTSKNFFISATLSYLYSYGNETNLLHNFADPVLPEVTDVRERSKIYVEKLFKMIFN